MSHIPVTFSTQPLEAVKRAGASFRAVEYAAKTLLLAQGRLTDTVFLLVSGLVKLTHVDSSGKEIIVGIRRSGWLLGVAAAILHQPQPAGAATFTRCQLLRIPAEEIRDLVGAESMFCKYLHELQAQEVHDHLLSAVELATHSTEERLVRLLPELALSTELPLSQPQPNVQIPLKQCELAALLGVTPEYLCRVMHQMERKGILVRKGRLLFAANVNKLSRLLP